MTRKINTNTKLKKQFTKIFVKKWFELVLQNYFQT